jgi:hypothetical protein
VNVAGQLRLTTDSDALLPVLHPLFSWMAQLYGEPPT